MREALVIAMCLATACAPTLAEQIRIRKLSDLAAADCKKTRDRCELALVCADSAAKAVKAIQAAQEATASGTGTQTLNAEAKGASAAAIASCAVGGWK